MSLLRTIRQPNFVRSVGSRTAAPATAITGRRFASGDYGSGEANTGTPNPSVDKEHPGPPPPNAAQQGKGQQQQPSGDKQQSSGSSGASKPQPKILSANPPGESEQSEEVARHNREMAQRADRPHEKIKNEDAEKDKVSPSFWSGGKAGEKDTKS